MDSESDIVKSYCFVEELASIASCTSRISRSIPGQVRRTFGPSVDPRAAKSALIAGVSVLSLLGARASQGITASFCVQHTHSVSFMKGTRYEVNKLYYVFQSIFTHKTYK